MGEVVATSCLFKTKRGKQIEFSRLVSREEARQNGLIFFFNGKACPNGHVAPRVVSGTTCIACLYSSESLEKQRMYHKCRSKRKRITYASCRQYHLKRNYGIDIATYDAMLFMQCGVCAICENKCSTGRKLAVDHDHKTGRVRGLLCAGCNMGIGKFKDDMGLLVTAYNYLKLNRGLELVA